MVWIAGLFQFAYISTLGYCVFTVARLFLRERLNININNEKDEKRLALCLVFVAGAAASDISGFFFETYLNQPTKVVQTQMETDDETRQNAEIAGR